MATRRSGGRWGLHTARDHPRCVPSRHGAQVPRGTTMHSSRSLLLALMATVAGGQRLGRRRSLDAIDLARLARRSETAARRRASTWDSMSLTSCRGWRTWARLGNGGKVDLRFRLDGQKLGTWAGFFVSGHIEWNYGGGVNQAAPGLNIIPVNIGLAYPSHNDSMFSLLFTQAFSPKTTLTFGLFNMFDAAARRPLVGGGGIDTFWNLAVGRAADEHHSALYLRHLTEHGDQRHRLIRPVRLRPARRAGPEHHWRTVRRRSHVQRHGHLPGDDRWRGRIPEPAPGVQHARRRRPEPAAPGGRTAAGIQGGTAGTSSIRSNSSCGQDGERSEAGLGSVRPAGLLRRQPECVQGALVTSAWGATTCWRTGSATAGVSCTLPTG